MISGSSIDGTYEREEHETLNPALFIIAKVDSCRLPFGKPKTIAIFAFLCEKVRSSISKTGSGINAEYLNSSSTQMVQNML